jgi:hypothetical protein
VRSRSVRGWFVAFAHLTSIHLNDTKYREIRWTYWILAAVFAAFFTPLDFEAFAAWFSFPGIDFAFGAEGGFLDRFAVFLLMESSRRSCKICFWVGMVSRRVGEKRRERRGREGEIREKRRRKSGEKVRKNPHEYVITLRPHVVLFKYSCRGCQGQNQNRNETQMDCKWTPNALL